MGVIVFLHSMSAAAKYSVYDEVVQRQSDSIVTSVVVDIIILIVVVVVLVIVLQL